MDIPQMPESIKWLAYAIGFYIIINFIKNISDLWDKMKTMTREDPRRRANDEAMDSLRSILSMLSQNQTIVIQNQAKMITTLTDMKIILVAGIENQQESIFKLDQIHKKVVEDKL